MINLPFVSIIIPVYHDWERLAVCLQALSDQSYPGEYFEIIVVNNAGDDVPEDLSFPLNCQVISEPESGSYAARNKGIRASKGDILGFTDSDCIPDTDWIQNAVNYFQEHKSCSRIGGKIRLFYRSRQLTKAELYEKVYAFNQDIYAKEDGTAATANMFAYRAVFNHIGLFNNKLMSGGDIEWSLRAKNAGYQISYVESAEVMHPARYRMEALVKKARRVGGGYELFNGNNHQGIIPFLQLVYNLRPPLGNFKLVFSKGKDLGFRQKILVMAIRYYLSAVLAIERFRVRTGKVPSRF